MQFQFNVNIMFHMNVRNKEFETVEELKDLDSTITDNNKTTAEV